MDRVFEHVIHEVWIRFDEVIEYTEYFKISLLFLIVSVECHIVCIVIHACQCRSKVLSVGDNGLIPFLHLLFLLLKAFEFLVNLFLHHSVEILLLNLQLLYNSSEGFFKSLNLFVKLLLHLLLKFAIQLLTNIVVLVHNLYLVKHFFY